jgi:hypothetical protein
MFSPLFIDILDYEPWVYIVCACVRACVCALASDGCLEKALDTAEFSREFQKHQHLFDPEHDYPALAKWVSSEGHTLHAGQSRL